jgi:GntR family transcriptional regulator/MocR family aminotransferase
MLVLSPRTQGTTLTQWLYAELRGAILDGRLRRGAAVPPTRSLAAAYGVSRRVVVNVFDQLREEGYLEARVGSGTRVSENVPEDYLLNAAPSARKKQRTPGAPASGALDTRTDRPVRAFNAFVPALTEFPIDLWTRLTGRCVRQASVNSLAGGDPAGALALREAIAEYLGTWRGVACKAEQVVITSGTQQALDLIARLVVRPHDKVCVEDPGYLDAIDIFRLAGAKIVGVPVDEHGIDPDIGRTRCRDARAIYVTPAHQFPLASTLRLDRRLGLLRWAREQHAVIVEDDYDSEFRFSGRPIPPIRGLAGADDVFLLGTFSKTLFPALRLGYIVVPDAWREPMVKLRRRIERYPPALPQAVLALFLSEGHFARHMRRMRELYGTRLACLRANVERHLHGVLKLTDMESGLNAPAILLNGMTSDEASTRARKRELEVWPLSRYCISRDDVHGLLLGFAAFNEREIRKGVIELARAFE